MGNKLAVQAPSDHADAPVGWGSRDELKEVADRLRRFVPGTKNMNDTEILAYAQLVHMTGLNPCRGEIYGWDSRGDGTGELVTKEHYAILVRWAKSQENFTTNFTCIAIGEKRSEDTTYSCRLLRQSDRPLLGQLLANGVDHQEALTWATTKGLGIVAASEKSKRKPPKSKDWAWVARKRALEDAIRQAFGKPSTRELARQTWIVEGVVTIPADWGDVTPEMLPSERDATALYSARRRLSLPLEQSAAESMADLGFPPDVTTEISPFAAADEATTPEPPDPQTRLETGNGSQSPTETPQGATSNGKWRNRGDLIYEASKHIAYYKNPKHILATLALLEDAGDIDWDMDDDTVFANLNAYATLRADEKAAAA